MSYWVIGGEFRDTMFTHLVRAHPTAGPFERYEHAVMAWRGRSMAHVDEAFVRFEIVQAESPPDPAALLQRAG